MKRGPNQWYKLALVAAALLLFGAAAVFQRRLNQQRADPALHLTRAAPLENAPPMLAFTTVALGSFRGLIANALWIRAQELQLDDKFFEMVQLADWITKLQPHMAQVWVMQAWNMSYNISVKFSAPEDRWRWVQRGIQLLRDEGLKYNPGEPLIYRELAWHFQHKIGQALDDAIHVRLGERALRYPARAAGDRSKKVALRLHADAGSMNVRLETSRKALGA